MSVYKAFLQAGVAGDVSATEAPAASSAMIDFGITSQLRAKHFLAQVLHESGGLRYFEEIASGAAYEGRKDLGNTQRGDGVRYKGRGPIQLTGRSNYRWAGSQLHLPLEAQPQLAAKHDVGWRIACLYWYSRGLNGIADRDDLLAITRAINGGLNGLEDRRRYLAKLADVDCRPIPARAAVPPPDPLEGYRADEIKWIRRYDELKRLKPRPWQANGEMAVLGAKMALRASDIWRSGKPKPVGDGHGMNYNRRIDRMRSLKSRKATSPS